MGTGGHQGKVGPPSARLDLNRGVVWCVDYISIKLPLKKKKPKTKNKAKLGFVFEKRNEGKDVG